jgi:hypothetical protein
MTWCRTRRDGQRAAEERVSSLVAEPRSVAADAALEESILCLPGVISCDPPPCRFRAPRSSQRHTPRLGASEVSNARCCIPKCVTIRSRKREPPSCRGNAWGRGPFEPPRRDRGPAAAGGGRKRTCAAVARDFICVCRRCASGCDAWPWCAYFRLVCAGRSALEHGICMTTACQ